MKYKVDIDVIERLKKGDETAFIEIHKSYYAYVFKIIFDIVKSTEIAKELASDVFLKMNVAITKLKNTSEFRSWIGRIARNTAIDQYRKDVKVNTIQLNEEKMYSYYGTPEIQFIISDALSTLNQIESKIIELKFFYNMTLKDIASKLEITANVVSYNYSTAKKKLKHYFHIKD